MVQRCRGTEVKEMRGRILSIQGSGRIIIKWFDNLRVVTVGVAVINQRAYGMSLQQLFR